MGEGGGEQRCEKRENSSSRQKVTQKRKKNIKVEIKERNSP